MNEKCERAVRAFIELGVQGDVAGIVDCFAEGASYRVNAANDALVGHDAIRQEIERQHSSFGDSRYELTSIGTVDNNVVFTERIDTVHMAGRDVTIHIVGVFELNDAGKITSYRDYFDTQEVETQLP